MADLNRLRSSRDKEIKLAKSSLVAKHKDTEEKLQSKLKDADAKLLRTKSDAIKTIRGERAYSSSKVQAMKITYASWMQDSHECRERVTLVSLSS